MKYVFTLLFILIISSPANAAGKSVSYEVNGEVFEGYYISPSPNAPLILLIHDWDGLTDYEVKRANMLVDMGYAIFAADLFGAGVRPTELKDKRQHTGELFKVEHSGRSRLLQNEGQAADSAWHGRHKHYHG
jgi:dienelactone hydrolase